MQAIDKNTKTHQKRFADRVSATDCYGFFNLLTGPKLLDVVEAQLPEHRERLYTPTLIPSQRLYFGVAGDNTAVVVAQYGNRLVM